MPRRYPIGEQDFQSIREEGKAYVDKTGIIFNLINDSKYNFLARPRRFGKSLLLSTIKAYFNGQKHLFEGLEILKLEKTWKKHPVLHLSFTNFDAGNPNSLTDLLDFQFTYWEKLYHITKNDYAFAQRFQNIIQSAYESTNEKVVILIDEYDHALINTLDREEIHGVNNELLKSVYSNLKEMDPFIRFSLLTGVTRFSKAGIFSGLNNLNDISFDDKYSAICGFTEEEIRNFLWEGVENLGIVENVTSEQALAFLKKEYDGYHFTKNLTDIYNPFSLLNALSKKEIQNYWIDSGTPSFLIDKLKETNEPFVDLFNEEADSSDLAATDTNFTSPVALLYQTGYLTIKGYDKSQRIFKLGIPNKEVREGFFSVLLSHLIEKDRRKTLREISAMKNCLENGNPDEFLERIRSFFAGISYKLMPKMPELYFENNLFLILNLMDFDVRAEDETSDGRIDLTVKTPEFIFVIEIKKDKNPKEALNQIEMKEYALKFKFDGRKVYKIGANFSSEKRNITDWLIEPIPNHQNSIEA